MREVSKSIKPSEAIFYAQAPVAFFVIMRDAGETTPVTPPSAHDNIKYEYLILST